ncbi:MAG TPA: class I SAM-dependent methyltransferase [Bacteroidales bacterium]|nr:class I SAM-dependent methyltransferase [Bacteroidales bacterium]
MSINGHKIANYFKYKILSSHKKGFGLHSPFVYNLVTKIFRNKFNPEIVCKIEEIRGKMLTCKETVEVKDYGTGRNNDNLRKISDIARNSSVPAKYGKLLASLAGEFGRENIIELGTSLGISTLYLSFGSPSSIIHTAEGCPSLSALAEANFMETGRSNIRLYNMKFDDFLLEMKKEKICPGLVFIDGDHSKESLLRYFDIISEICDEKSLVVIDDIHISKEMYEAWEKIKQSGKVSITIDIYQMGLVFFRRGIARYDYIIRY